MVDEFLLEKIREKMKEKGATIDSVRQSFEKIYREKDIELAVQAYRAEEEKRVTAQAIEAHEQLARKRERSFSSAMVSFVFHQPYLWLAVSVFIFIRLYEWRSSLLILSPMMQAVFLVFFIIIFFIIVFFISRAIGWVASFHEMYGKPGKVILRGVQLQIMNLAVIFGISEIARTHPVTVLIIFIVIALIFEVVLISVAYRLDFSGAISTFLFFQLLFWVLWLAAHVVINLVFTPAGGV